MATPTATKPPAAEAEAAAPAASGKKKIILIAAPLAAVLAAWFFFLGPGAGGKGEAEPEAPKAPKAGAVLELDPITMNLADGRLLKVGLALQKVKEPKEYELSGSKALDEAISFLGQHTFDQLAVPAQREAAKAELSKRVGERYDGDVMDVYFTEFVMQ